MVKTDLIVYGGSIALLLFVLWPIVYLRKKGGKNSVLFIFSSLGALTGIGILLEVVGMPFSLFLNTIAPQLAENRTLDQILPLVSIYEVVTQWAGFVVYPLLYLLLPSLFYRRYDVFRINKSSKKDALTRASS